MKTSNKILLITLAVIFLLTAGFIITSRILISCEPWAEYDLIDDEEYEIGDFETKLLALQDFDEIDIEGNWHLTIRQADSFRVEIEAPRNILDELRAETAGSRLLLDYRHRRVRDHRLRASVDMPQLTRIQSDYGSSIRFEGFTMRDLDLRTNGGSHIVGQDNAIENLFVVTNGAAYIDLKETATVNADLNLNGAGSVILNMAGGELTGSANGACKIDYYGEISRRDFESSGFVSFDHHK